MLYRVPYMHEERPSHYHTFCVVTKYYIAERARRRTERLDCSKLKKLKNKLILQLCYDRCSSSVFELHSSKLYILNLSKLIY